MSVFPRLADDRCLLCFKRMSLEHLDIQETTATITQAKEKHGTFQRASVLIGAVK